MIKNIFKMVRGFSPVELVIMVGFGALTAAALIYLGTTPHYMASSQPINVNVKVDRSSMSRQPSAKANMPAELENRGQKKKFFPDGTTLTKPTAKASMSNKPSPDPGHLKKPDGTPATAGSQEIWVYPRAQHVVQPQVGTYRDVDNVQWAVDNVASGGKVKLMTTDPADSAKKAFYFGDDSNARDYVYISKPVTITGEQLSSSQSLALPKGGTLSSDRAAIYGGGGLGYIGGTFNIDSSGKVTVDGVRFDNSGAAAILVNNCNGADIKNNVITNLKPSALGGSLYFGIGILVNGIFGQLPNGTIDITSNNVDVYGLTDPVVPDGSLFFGAGIAVSDSFGSATINIKQNTIKNPGASGIWLAGFANSKVVVDSNKVYQRTSAMDYSPYAWGNGLVAEYHSPFGTVIPEGEVDVINNEFYGLDMSNWAMGTGIQVNSKPDSLIENNTLQGSVIVGIDLWGTKDSIIRNNHFANNLFYYVGIFLEAAGSYLGENYIATENITVVEPDLACWTWDILDFGINNHVTAGGVTCY